MEIGLDSRIHLEKKTCPYCGHVGKQERVIRKKKVLDGETGELIRESGDDYLVCPKCGIGFGGSYGILYLRTSQDLGTWAKGIETV